MASSGTPDAGGSLGELPITMSEGFWRTWDELNYQKPEAQWQGATFMFEFMSPWNRVIVEHPQPRLVLIGVRGADGVEKHPEEFAHCGWDVVGSFPLNSLEGVFEAAAVLKPLEAEGYVVCDADFQRVKIKSPAYVALHLLRDSFSRRRLVEILQRGESEEFLAYFPHCEPEYRDVKARFDALVETVTTAWLALPFVAPDQQPRFAEIVKATPYAAVFFAMRSGKVAGPKEFYAGITTEQLLRLLDAPPMASA